MADIVGKRLCVDMDLSSGVINERAVSNLKKMTGGDQLSTDVKYMARVQFVNTAKILFATNHAISIVSGVDGALMRRIVVIPFTRTIPQSEQNFDLLAYLEAERDAVVVKALSAYSNLRDRKYVFSGDYTVNATVSGGSDLPDCVWIAQGISPLMVARLLGHCDVKMLTKVYDHTTVDTLREAITSTKKKETE